MGKGLPNLAMCRFILLGLSCAVNRYEVWSAISVESRVISSAVPLTDNDVDNVGTVFWNANIYKDKGLNRIGNNKIQIEINQD